MSAPSHHKPRVLSGIQPTADSFHLGNYLGAIRQWVAMQDDTVNTGGECFFFLADLHAISMPHDPATLSKRHFQVAVLDEPRTVHDLHPARRISF